VKVKNTIFGCVLIYLAFNRDNNISILSFPLNFRKLKKFENLDADYWVLIESHLSHPKLTNSMMKNWILA